MGKKKTTTTPAPDILDIRIPAPQVTPVSEYPPLIEQCKEQLAIAEDNEKRFAVIRDTMQDKQDELEQALILAWDDTAAFSELSDQYNALRTAFELAPLAATYWQQRAHKLRQHSTYLNKAHRQAEQRDRQEAQEAQRLAEYHEQLEAERAQRELDRQEREAQRQERKRVKAERAQEQAQRELDVQSDLSKWLKGFLGNG